MSANQTERDGYEALTQMETEELSPDQQVEVLEERIRIFRNVASEDYVEALQEKRNSLTEEGH